MTEGLIALAGVVLGVWLRGKLDHRLWLRDARRDAYASFLYVLNELAQRASTYMTSMSSVAEVGASLGEKDRDVRQDIWKNWTRELRGKWEAYSEALEKVKREESLVELVGSDAIHRAAFFARATHSFPPTPPLLDDETDLESLMQYNQDWKELEDSRHDARRDFIQACRDELRVNRGDPSRTWRHLRTKIRKRSNLRKASHEGVKSGATDDSDN